MAESRSPAGGARARTFPALLACLGLLATPACSFVPRTEPPPVRPPPSEVDAFLTHRPLAAAEVKVTPEPITVEDAFILDLYTFFHARDYATFKLEYPGELGGTAVAHLLIPPGAGRRPTVVVFDILAGGHVVGEAMAKALVRRGFLVARLEREDLKLDTTEDADTPARALRAALLDARRLVDYLETRPDVDAARIGAAGISLGSILACLLQGTDPRVRAGVFIMTGGDVAQILGDSTEVPVRVFRENTMQRDGLTSEAEFVERMRPLIDPLDPLRVAGRIDPDSVLFMNARLDRVIRPRHAMKLWVALGKPERIVLPFGHYQLLPSFWWCMARAADHFERVLGAPGPGSLPVETQAAAPSPTP